jgi:hypothetical protein
VPIDRRVSRDAGGISAKNLDRLFRESPASDVAVGTAVAVCIGAGYANDDAATLCNLFGDLLASPHERVRYRASQSIIQRVFDGTLPDNTASELWAAVNRSLKVERSELNARSLVQALPLEDELSCRGDEMDLADAPVGI